MSRTFSRILMNHKIGGDVHDEYMTVPAMFDQLRTAQERLSAAPKGAVMVLHSPPQGHVDDGLGSVAILRAIEKKRPPLEG